MLRRRFLSVACAAGATALSLSGAADDAKDHHAAGLLEESRQMDVHQLKMDLHQLKTELSTYGFAIIPDLISTAEAESAARRITKIMESQPEHADPDQHLRGPLDYLDERDYPLFAKLLAHPVCLELAKHLLGEGFQLTEPGCRWRKPGCGAGPVHITTPIEQFVNKGFPTPNTCFVVPFSWNLNDLTAEMGATYYLPFSQFAPGAPWPGMTLKHAVPGTGAAGSLVIHHGGMWHGFGPNTTAAPARVGLMAGYCAAWMDPTAAGHRLMKRSIRDRMPEAVQKLNLRVAED
jgi:ectoine hydroxylase-related dioxygenase (phytanoyl-CoA dioxygenase family)